MLFSLLMLRNRGDDITRTARQVLINKGITFTEERADDEEIERAAAKGESVCRILVNGIYLHGSFIIMKLRKRCWKSSGVIETRKTSRGGHHLSFLPMDRPTLMLLLQEEGYILSSRFYSIWPRFFIPRNSVQVLFTFSLSNIIAALAKKN